jgi:LmbE family N-acetylglucosaminyl deacetylase
LEHIAIEIAQWHNWFLVVLLPALLWIAGVLVATDLSVPALDARRYRNVLAVFAHADDELVSCGGTLRRLAARGGAVTLVILTKGERGTRGGTLQPELKAVRTKEARAAASLLRIADVVQADLGDGLLHERRREISTFLERTIERVEPDLLITHDLAGLYGHSDHIACAEVVTELRRSRFPGCALWYPALPRGVQAIARLTGQLPVDPRRADPTGRLFIGGAGVLAKIRAWRVYESQRASLGRGMPLWLSVLLFEHFEAVPAM